MLCNSSSSGVCRVGCKDWHRIPSPTRSILPRRMHLPTTSTRRARLPIRISTAGIRTLTSGIHLPPGVTYDLPSPGSQQGLSMRYWAAGRWTVSCLARSAPPVDVVGAMFRAAGIALYPRPNVNPGVPLDSLARDIPAARSSIRRLLPPRPPGSRVISGAMCCGVSEPRKRILGCSGNFTSPRRCELRFRAEFFNILNHPNFGNPINSLTSPLFGRSTQTLANSLGSGGANGGLNPLYQIGGPRSIQLALKLQF